jgi:hypothetical protein
MRLLILIFVLIRGESDLFWPRLHVDQSRDRIQISEYSVYFLWTYCTGSFVCQYSSNLCLLNLNLNMEVKLIGSNVKQIPVTINNTLYRNWYCSHLFVIAVCKKRIKKVITKNKSEYFEMKYHSETSVTTNESRRKLWHVAPMNYWSLAFIERNMKI